MTTESENTDGEVVDTSAASVVIVQDTNASVALCNSCQKCLIQVCKAHHANSMGWAARTVWPDLAATYKSSLHDSFESWDDAVRLGCWICCQFQEYIPASTLAEWAKTSTIPEAIMYSAKVFDDKPFTLSITAGDHRMGLAIRRSLDKAIAQTVTLDIGTTSNSPSAWTTILKWLNDCVHEHESCRRLESLRDATWYPTRLLDLGPADGSGNVNVVETANKKLAGFYITLSHCWGTGRHIRLTKENRAALLNEIPDFPKTFAEAISATRKLGVRYLWIDSLCIIQNDAEDWARESALMHRVYRNAWCNIAAAASQNSSEGLFRERKAKAIGELVVDLEGIGRIGVTDERLFVGEIDNSPLQKRAWVLQERLLSQRVLHFGERQLFWECYQLHACERFPDGLVEGITNDAIRQIFNSAISENSTTSWNAIVENYTRRSLTYTSDKLPALSGSAKTLSTIMGGIYLAGMWNNESLVQQLAWSTSGAKSSLCPRPDYRAPSWSWACVDDSVTFWHKKPDAEFKQHVELIEAHVEPIGSDETGAVKSASLSLRGQLKRVVQAKKDEFQKAFKLQFDTCEDTIGDLFFLPLFIEWTTEYTRYEDEDWYYSGYYLILARDASDSKSYRRVGFATTEWYDTDDDQSQADVDPRTFLEDTGQARPGIPNFSLGKGKGSKILIL